MIIAIDGPAGAGKSTVAKILAKKLGFLYIDTGAMYRALTFKALDNGIDVYDEGKVNELALNTSIGLCANADGSLSVLLDGKDVSLDIRRPRITKYVSDVSKIKRVREILVEMQREMGRKGDCVLEGRDIGTVVFPEAQRKFFIDASAEVRAGRRFKELKESNQNVAESDVAADLANRDRIDSTREISPLRKAPDAIYIDTSELSIDGVVEKMLELCR